MTEKKRVLFICTHNAARSQMAEGYLRGRYGDRYDAFSAGTSPASISPLAIRVMAEIGIDISAQRSKPLSDFFRKEMDTVVTVCDMAHGVCPAFPWTKESIHAEFPDPEVLTGTADEIIIGFRQIRDAITEWIDIKFGNSRPDELDSE